MCRDLSPDAVDEHMHIWALAAGRDESRAIAAQQQQDRVNVHQIQYSYTMPQGGGGEIISAHVLADCYEYTDAYNEQELAIAATIIAADYIATAGSDAPSAYRNLDSFVTAASDRGVGFRGPQRVALVLWFANVGMAPATRRMMNWYAIGDGNWRRPLRLKSEGARFQMWRILNRDCTWQRIESTLLIFRWRTRGAQWARGP